MIRKKTEKIVGRVKNCLCIEQINNDISFVSEKQKSMYDATDINIHTVYVFKQTSRSAKNIEYRTKKIGKNGF